MDSPIPSVGVPEPSLPVVRSAIFSSLPASCDDSPSIESFAFSSSSSSTVSPIEPSSIIVSSSASTSPIGICESTIAKIIKLTPRIFFSLRYIKFPSFALVISVNTLCYLIVGYIISYFHLIV